MNTWQRKQHKAYANNIVGLWHMTSFPGEMLLFSFLDDLEGEADVMIFDEHPKRNHYSIVSRMENFWFLIIWERGDKETVFYLIEILESSLMILIDKNNDKKVFTRKHEIEFANKVLKNLGKP